MNNKNNKEVTYPRFLDNKPCGKDLFEGKSHETIAQNIVNVIENNNSKIIGIDGGWGSGKSNMVNLIKDKLNKNKFHFFIYDAWGHQTDFQKRSILENLTGYLVDEAKILNKDKWNGRLLQLLSRKRSVGSKYVREMSAVSKIGAILAFIMPILILTNNYIDNAVARTLIFTIIFVISLIGLYILQVRNLKKNGQPTDFSNVISELFLSYQDYTNNNNDNIEQSMKYETIYDEEPSSRDFKNWMKDIDNDIKENKLIIVFDNMDRLPTDKVQELWASIHTFFAEEKYNNIHVIVPFDREHIKSAFKSEDIVLNQNDNNKSICFGNDFINKTFDVVYRVSPPVMSDWKTYFSDRWEEAFGEKADNKITQIYDLLSKSTTPREIIAFINEFVSIKQLSDNSIPNEYIALFILGKDKISSNPQKEILQPNYLGALDFMYKNDSNLPKFISALYYQLPPERALDIIYTENLKQALDNANIDQIESIQSQEKLFFSILENAIAKITNFSNAIVSLDKCFKNNNSQNEQMIWDCIYFGVKQLSIKEPLQQYQKILLTKIKGNDKDEYLKTLVLGFSNIQEFDAISFYSSIKQLSEMDDIDPYRFLSEKEVDAKSFISFVEQAKSDYKKFKITCSQNKLDNFLCAQDSEYFENLNIIPFIKDEYKTELYANHLKDLIHRFEGAKEKIASIISRLKEIEQPITNIISDSSIFSHFSNSNENETFYYDLICMRIARLDNFPHFYVNSFSNVLNKSDNAFAEKISQVIEYYMDYDDILLNAHKYPLLKIVAKKITEESSEISKLDLLKVLPKYDEIINSIDINPTTLIERLNEWDCECINIENINSIPYNFFEDSISTNNELVKHCRNICSKYLESININQWKNDLLTKSKNCKLLLLLGVNAVNTYEALEKLLLEKAKNENSSLSTSTYNSLVDLAKRNKRPLISMFKNLRDSFCNNEAKMTSNLFKFFGEHLFEYANLEEKKEVQRTILIPSILDDNNNLQLLERHQDTISKIINNAGEESYNFKEKIKSLLDGTYKDNQEFKNFAKSIGIQSQTEMTNDEKSV